MNVSRFPDLNGEAGKTGEKVVPYYIRFYIRILHEMLHDIREEPPFGALRHLEIKLRPQSSTHFGAGVD